MNQLIAAINNNPHMSGFWLALIFAGSFVGLFKVVDWALSHRRVRNSPQEHNHRHGALNMDDTVGLLRLATRRVKGVDEPFQQEVHRWMLVCFGEAILADKAERNQRFLEESLELVQACGYDRNAAHRMVDYVFNRPVGEIKQEVGGVRVTLSALCIAHEVHDDECGDTEIVRCWGKVDKIREKQKQKPAYSTEEYKPS